MVAYLKQTNLGPMFIVLTQKSVSQILTRLSSNSLLGMDASAAQHINKHFEQGKSPIIDKRLAHRQ